MVKLLIGPDIALLEDETRLNLKSEEKNNEGFSFFTFDMYNTFIQDAVEEAESVSFFASKKVIIITNCYFLSPDMDAAPRSFDSQQDYASLIKYLEHPNPDADIYLLTQGKKLAGERGNDLIKSLHKYADIEVSSELRPEELCQKGLRYVGSKGADISSDALSEIVDRTYNSYAGMINALDKLLCYTNKIRPEDVELLVAPKIENSVFSVVSYLFKNNTREAIRSYRDLRKGGIDPMQLLPIFASQFRFMYLVSFLMKKGLNTMDMSKKLNNASPIRIKYTCADIGNLEPKDILRMLGELGTIEDHIKFDLDDPDLLIELFLVNFYRKYLRNAR